MKQSENSLCEECPIICKDKFTKQDFCSHMIGLLISVKLQLVHYADWKFSKLSELGEVVLNLITHSFLIFLAHNWVLDEDSLWNWTYYIPLVNDPHSICWQLLNMIGNPKWHRYNGVDPSAYTYTGLVNFNNNYHSTTVHPDLRT